MSSQHVETLIIGAGQAGLSTGYHLKRRGRPFLVVDGNQRIGDNWRQQWDTRQPNVPDLAGATWERLGARYDTAHCRTLLGRALRALGDDQTARAELTAARRAFADLGAKPAEREVAALLHPTLP